MNYDKSFCYDWKQQRKKNEMNNEWRGGYFAVLKYLVTRHIHEPHACCLCQTVPRNMSMQSALSLFLVD